MSYHLAGIFCFPDIQIDIRTINIRYIVSDVKKFTSVIIRLIDINWLNVFFLSQRSPLPWLSLRIAVEHRIIRQMIPKQPINLSGLIVSRFSCSYFTTLLPMNYLVLSVGCFLHNFCKSIVKKHNLPWD